MDLLEINKFTKDRNEFVLVEELEPIEEEKRTITRPRGGYNLEVYKEHHNNDSISFLHLSFLPGI